MKKKSVTSLRPIKSSPSARGVKPLLADIRGFILNAREQTAHAIDAGLTILNWQIGHRIHKEILREKRATYGAEIVATLSRQLEREFGKGFNEKNIRRMVQFAETFPDGRIVATLSRQLGWSHFKEILPIQDPLKRDFYAEMCRIERWSVRTLRDKIGGMLFERTALSKKPQKLIKRELAALRQEDKLSPDLVFRDPYILDFLGLKDTYAEKDLETAILREIESFILELGAGFCFVGRQLRMHIGGKDYYLDLLFYHRKLRRLVALDLKLRDFEAGDKGQMELYVNYLKRYECQPGEESPLGIILCAGKSQEHVELLDLAKSGIHVAGYWTKILPKKQLERKLHNAVRLARARIERASG